MGAGAGAERRWGDEPDGAEEKQQRGGPQATLSTLLSFAEGAHSKSQYQSLTMQAASMRAG